MSIAARVKRLERTLDGGGQCADRVDIILAAGAPIPPDTPRCQRCGAVHVLCIEEGIVEAGPSAGRSDCQGARMKRIRARIERLQRQLCPTAAVQLALFAAQGGLTSLLVQGRWLRGQAARQFLDQACHERVPYKALIGVRLEEV